jgi:hypothetical protein
MLLEVTLESVKKVITQEEYEQAARGQMISNSLEVHASDFVTSGIELEDQL